ncbi:MAG: AEC family transporter [Eubacteriales bacterium]|nr:AEC family transporter [Eubacteriales bacterium]
MNIIVISEMLQLFLILALGYISAKTKVVNEKFGIQLSSFIILITMPCMIIASVAAIPGDTEKNDILPMFIISVLFFVLMPFISWLITRILHVKKEESHLYIYMTIFSNVGFMGYPLIASIFGEGAILYASIFNLIAIITNFTLGIILMSKGGEKNTLNLKNLLSPGIIASLFALTIFIANIRLPDMLNNTLKTIGETTTPLAMIVIGIELSNISIKSVFSELKLYPYAVIRQVLLPAAAWLILKNVISSQYILGIVIIIIAMPVTTSAVLFANKYENNVQLATKGIFITTLLSVVTIPLIAYFLL